MWGHWKGVSFKQASLYFQEEYGRWEGVMNECVVLWLHLLVLITSQLYQLEKVNQSCEQSSFQYELMKHLGSTRQHARRLGSHTYTEKMWFLLGQSSVGDRFVSKSLDCVLCSKWYGRKFFLGGGSFLEMRERERERRWHLNFTWEVIFELGHDVWVIVFCRGTRGKIYSRQRKQHVKTQYVFCTHLTCLRPWGCRDK